jgi:hypothetical protein
VQSLLLRPIEVIAKNLVHKFRLRDTSTISFTFDEDLVRVAHREWPVLVWKCPRTYMTVKLATTAGAALDDVALLAQGLQIPQLVRALPVTWNFVVWTELHIWLLTPTGRAPEPMLLPQLQPVPLAKLHAGFALLPDTQALQLVARAFLDYGSETLITLEFPHTPEYVFVSYVASRLSECIDGGSNTIFGDYWARNPVCCRPERLQDYRVIKLVRPTRRNKPSFSVSKPPLPPILRFVRSDSRSDMQALAGSRLRHSMELPKCA